jgi:GH35 family endo-1,4-beta-xylanase
MVVVIRNERDEEVGRHVVGVGAVFPGESRSFSVAVEAVPASPGKRRLKH